MPLARITKTPAGQRVMNLQNEDPIEELVPGVPYVAQVVQAVEEDRATLEAEGGEAIVGDVNRDGMLEFMRINGPSHARGGVQLDVDPGSFIYSDSKRLRIKDPETLAKFMKGTSKKGMTPADVAKQYDLNTHVQNLKSEDTDAFTKQTAQLMLDTQSQKLAELALEQEKLKGLPNGVPLITQQLLPNLAAQYMDMGKQQTAEQMPTFQDGGQTGLRNKNTPWSAPGQETVAASNSAAPLPKAGSKLYLNETAIKVQSVDVSALSSDPNAAYITLSNGAKLTKKQWQQVHSEKPLLLRSENKTMLAGESPFLGVAKDDRYIENGGRSGAVPQAYSNKPQQLRRNFGKDLNLGKGDQLTVNDTAYEVLDPHGEYDKGYGSSWKSWRDTLDNTKGIIKAKNKKTGEIEYLEGEDVLQAKKNAPEYFKHAVYQRPIAAPKKATPTADWTKDWPAGYDANGTYVGVKEQPSELEQLMAMPDIGPATAPKPVAHKTPPQVVHSRPRPTAVPTQVPSQNPAAAPPVAQGATPSPVDADHQKALDLFNSI